MVARKTVSQSAQSLNSAPRHGVLTLVGYGIQVRVDRGHLVVQDGIGAERRRFRLARVGHGLNRLVVIGSDGVISLAALRWLADQDASFVLLERDGKVLEFNPAPAKDENPHELGDDIIVVATYEGKWIPLDGSKK